MPCGVETNDVNRQCGVLKRCWWLQFLWLLLLLLLVVPRPNAMFRDAQR